MQFKKYKKNLLIISLIAFLGQARCGAVLIDPISIKVISMNAGHTGYYIAESDPIQYFNGGVLISGISAYEENIGPSETTTVSATSNTGATSLVVQIYRDGELVKEDRADGISTPTTVTVKYVYGEENNPPAP